MGSKIEKDPITITGVDGSKVTYTGTTGAPGSAPFAARAEGTTITFANGPQAVYVNEVEAKYGPTHGLGRRKTRKSRRRHGRKTRRSRK
jgi:hypothetical protein